MLQTKNIAVRGPRDSRGNVIHIAYTCFKCHTHLINAVIKPINAVKNDYLSQKLKEDEPNDEHFYHPYVLHVYSDHPGEFGHYT